MTEPLLSGPALLERAGLALAVPLVAALDGVLLDSADPVEGLRATATEAGLNGAGALHASALAALLESAAYLALLPHLGTAEHAVTHTVTLHLLAGVPAGVAVTVTGDVDRRTRRLAFCSAVARRDDQVVARAQLVKSVVAWPA